MADTTDMPTISITQDYDEDVSDCQSDVGDFKATYTDLEDLDSNDEDGVQKKLIKSLKKTAKRGSTAITDIEDFQDSNSEDEKSEGPPEITISLKEYLDAGHTEEKTQLANKITSRSDSTVKEGKFKKELLNEDDPGCITDCENYDSSGEDVPNEQLAVNDTNNNARFTPESGNVNISDACTKQKDFHYEISDDDEEEGACALSRIANGKASGNVSEIEDIYLSGDEEIVQFEASSEEEFEPYFFPINVTFIPATSTSAKGINSQRSSAAPSPLPEDPATEVEKLNSSDSDPSTESNHPGMPAAKVSCESLTDIEDLDLGETADLIKEMQQQIKDVNIPAPIREITITKEDENGVPVTHVMPLRENIHLGIHNYYKDKGLTDTEDISVNEDEIPEISPSPVKEQDPDIINAFVENANIQNCESVKTSSQRSKDLAEQEPVTEVEEIFMAGTVRRRKNKTKTQSKPKSKYLEVKPNVEQVTDVEELDVSDFESSSSIQKCNQKSGLLSLRVESPEQKTDVEYVTGEDEGEHSEDEQKSEVSIPGQENFFSTVTSVEALTQQGVPIVRKPSPVVCLRRKGDESGSSSQYPTDIEDVQLTSDVEDNRLYETYSRADTVSPGELQEILNGGSMSVVHEKNQKAFNVDEEKIHIKGMHDLSDAHTDVEYLDEEIVTDKKHSKISSTEEEVTAGTKVVFEGQPTLFEPDEGDIDYVRNEVANLVDSILEQSVMIVNAQQCNDYNSESEHYAITCDVNGFDMVKSPTIESLSGKSFDDNMSVNDDNNTVNVPPLITTTTDIVTTSSSVDRTDRNDNNRNFVNDQSNAMPSPSADVDLDMNRSEKKFDRIERKFERLSSQLDDLEESAVRFDTDFDSMLSKDDVSNLQSDFSKISWDESASGATTAADVGLSTPDNDLQDLPTEPSGDTARSETEIPKPTPRISKTLPSDIVQVQEEILKKTEIEKETKSPTKDDAIVEDVDFKQSKKFWESLESAQSETQPMPVPKPRSQLKAADSLKGDESVASVKSSKGDESQASLKSSSHDSKISSEQQVEYSETSSLHTSLEEDKHKEDDSVMSDDRIEDETYPDLDKIHKKPDDEDDGVKTHSDHEDDDDGLGGEKQASFYIGESSSNIITKSSTDKRHDFAFDNKGYEETFDEDRDTHRTESKDEDPSIVPQAIPRHIDAKDVEEALIITKDISASDTVEALQKEEKEILKDTLDEDIADVVKEVERKKSPTRIFRQDSETRNDILECETFLEREKTYSTERESFDFKKESIEAVDDIEDTPTETPITGIVDKFLQEEQVASSKVLSHQKQKTKSKTEEIKFEEIEAKFSTVQTIPQYVKEEKQTSSFEAFSSEKETTAVKSETSKTETSVSKQTHEAKIEDHTIQHTYFEEQITPFPQEAISEIIPSHTVGVVESQVLKQDYKKVEEKSEVTSKTLHTSEKVGGQSVAQVTEYEIGLRSEKLSEDRSRIDEENIRHATVDSDTSKTILHDEYSKTHTTETHEKKISEETHKLLHKTEEKCKETTTIDGEQPSEMKVKFEPKLDLNLDKSELELSEKSFSKTSKYEESIASTEPKPVLSPVKGFKGFATLQDSKEGFKKTLLIEPSQVDQSIVEQTLEEVKESLDAVQEELIEVVKDGKLIKESPSEFEFKMLPNIKYTADTIQESFQEEATSSTTTEQNKDQSKTDTFEEKIAKFEEATSVSSADDSSKLEVVHRVRKETKTDSLNRWSVQDVDQSSSGDTSSQYQSFEKSDSRPLSSDIENLLHSSDYQTAQDASLLPESTEYISAVSTLDHSGKTISSQESMKSFDSESSANLGSIEVSEMSETLVPSTAEGDVEEDLDADDSDRFCGVLMEDFKRDDEPIASQMKRSQEMTFKHETVEHEFEKDEDDFQTFPRLSTSAEESRLEELKFPSSLEEGSILSMSLSSASAVDTVIENAEDLAGSLGASSLAGIHALIRDDYTGTSFEEPSKTEKIDSMVMTTTRGKEDDTNYVSTQITTTVVSAESSDTEPKRKGHKRSESAAFGATDFLKGIEIAKAKGDSLEEEEEEIKTITEYKEEKKESESESDYDAYESEYSRAYKSPSTQKKSKEKRVETFEKDQDPEKRPFTPSQSVSEPIIEDVSEEAEPILEDFERRPSQNMQDYSKIPDIMITEDLKKYTEEGEEIPDEPEPEEDFKDKVLYKVKTEEDLPKADDAPLHYAKEHEYSMKEDQLQDLIQREFESKTADMTKFSREEEEKADSPDSFEMLEQPDISDEFVIIEEVAKEANEFDTEGKSISIKNVKYIKKHDEEVEQILVKSAPAAPNEGSTLYRDDLNFEFEESPPTGQEEEGAEASDAAALNKRWVEMQLSDNASHLRYPYEIGGGILEDIKEEDTEFEVGSSRISSFKDSFSSTPEYDVLAGRKYFARGEHDDVSMSSLQEFESLEQAISLENRKMHHQGHQGSQDSLSNGSFTRRYMLRSGGQGDDISLSSLKEFEGLENACMEAHLIEIKAKEEAALLLSRSDESNKSNTSNGEAKSAVTKTVTTVTTVTHAKSGPSEKPFPKTPQEIEALIKAKLEECEEESSNLMEVSSDSLELGMKKSKSSNGDGIAKSSEHGSCDSLEINKSGDIMTSSIDSFEISKDATARSSRSDVDSLEQQLLQDVRRDSVDSIELEQALQLPRTETEVVETSKDQKTTITTTTVMSQGPSQIVTRTVTTTSSHSTGPDDQKEMIKDISSDSLNLKTDPEQLLTSTESLLTSSTATNATYQNENDSLMSGSMTSCGSNTMIDTLDSTFAEMYQGGSSSSQFLYEETRSQIRTQSRDGEKRYEYFEIFEKDLEILDTSQSKPGGDASPEPKQDDQKK